MIYTLPYQSEKLLMPNYLTLRNIIDVGHDCIHLTISERNLQDVNENDIYKSILKWDGNYRRDHNKWEAPAVKVRVIKQL